MGDGLRTMLDHDRELRLLADLCRELAKLGARITLSDARPAVRVRVGGNWAGLSVLMDSSTDLFTWGGDQTHPVSDRVGAATAIVAYVEELEGAASSEGVESAQGCGGSGGCGD